MDANSDFANMWKELQSPGKSSTLDQSLTDAKQTRPNGGEPSLKDAAKALGHIHMSPPSTYTHTVRATRPRSLSREDPERNLPARESTSPVEKRTRKEKKNEQDKNVSNTDTERTKISLDDLFSTAVDKSQLMKSVSTEDASGCDRLLDLDLQEDSTNLSVSPKVKDDLSPVGSLQVLS